MTFTNDPAGLHITNLTQWLATHLPESFGPSSITATLLPGGRSNISYVITGESGQSIVLRRPPLGHVMPSAHDMKREYQVLSGLNQIEFPTPTALAFCDDTHVIGAPFMVMSFVEGRVFSEVTQTENLSPVSAHEMSQSLMQTLAQLHCINANDAGLGSLGRPEGYLERQVKRWGEQWALSKTRELTEMVDLHSWLAQHTQHLPSHRPSAIVHGDYRIDNVIFDPHSNSIIAVLDWEMATLGDPISDLAIALVYWTRPHDNLRTLIPVAQHITDSPGFWTREEILHDYAQRTHFSLEHLDFCVALACFKLAVIMESIHKRSLSGHQLGPAGDGTSSMSEAARALAVMGLTATQSGALKALGS